MKPIRMGIPFVAFLIFFPLARAGAGISAEAVLEGLDGEVVGEVRLRELPHGLLLDVSVHDVPGGTHAIHVHETGRCEPPFESAGGHFDPESRSHGLADPEGAHVGDLPNLHVPRSGTHRVELFLRDATLAGKRNALLDDDGAAIVIHRGVDDHESDPSGGAGERIACGVIRRGQDDTVDGSLPVR